MSLAHEAVLPVLLNESQVSHTMNIPKTLVILVVLLIIQFLYVLFETLSSATDRHQVSTFDWISSVLMCVFGICIIVFGIYGRRQVGQWTRELLFDMAEGSVYALLGALMVYFRASRTVSEQHRVPPPVDATG